ncbi:hypothetical protein QFC22_003237 [Naganishia vaughanmartiniae]|uniref:Uncharacterized protein n=1 Tax=Naganishia vaughanmartiniae TaxID=1424756 RepID=A0ACC2X695_9TREE|nr:hypothetical protein QFC22_003237 [Naganishia vaughanmartiniae]
MQMQPLSHLANHQQALVNGEGLRQRKPSHNVQQQQQSLQHSRTFKPPSWDQNAAPVPALDTCIPQTDKTSSINGFSATRLQLSPQNYQLQPPNHTDVQVPSGVYRQTNTEKNARQSSDQSANLQVQVNERERPAHLAMNGQIGSTAGQQGHPKQVPSLDSGLTIQVPTSASETAASSTPLSSAFRPQRNPSQTEVNMNGMTNHGQLFDLSRTVERLAKAQADMFAFLQAEMSRRKTWEEQCLHEIRRRNSHSDSLSTQGSSAQTGSRHSASTGAPGTVTSDNNPMALSLNLPFNHTNGNNMAISMANEIHHDLMQRATGMTPNGNTTYLHPVSNSHTPSTTMASVGNFPTTAATQNHVNGASFPLPMNGGLSNGKVPIASDDKGSNALAQLPPPTNHVSTLGIPTEPIGNEEPAQSVPAGADSETSTKAEEVPKQRKRPRTDSNIDSERAGKRFAVNDRGIVYMAGGSTKSTQTPTKIQSIVRKTLYASMGVPADLEGGAMPIYVQDMAPPDGSDDWKFGNLRFDWNSTMRRCVHNKKMRDIVLEHIISLRGEYSEIADSEFVQARLEQAFDQAFATWKGKYLGKRSGGIRRTTTVKKLTQAEAPTPTQLPDATV